MGSQCQSIEVLPDGFFQLLGLGVDPPTAHHAVALGAGE